MQEELRLGELGMRFPGRGLDGIGAAGTGIGRIALDVGLVENANTGKLTRLSGAVAGSQYHGRRNESP